MNLCAWHGVHWFNDVDKKKLKTLKESLIENCVGEIEKDRKRVIFWDVIFWTHTNQVFLGE